MISVLEKQRVKKRRKSRSPLRAAGKYNYAPGEALLPMALGPAAPSPPWPLPAAPPEPAPPLSENPKAAPPEVFRGLLSRLRIFSRPRYLGVLSALGALVFTGLILLRPFSAAPLKPIPLPADPGLYSYLLAQGIEEFDGQGSGEILPPDMDLITPVNPVNYVVRRGDTVGSIARQFGVTERTLIGFNGITDVYRIAPGMELAIPDMDGLAYQVKAGETLASIGAHFGVEINALLDANDLSQDLLSVGQSLFIPGARMSEYDYRKATKTLFIYPARARLSSPFGYRADPFNGTRRYHNGLDLANSIGTPIYASMEGTVIDTADRTTGYGRSIVIQHANGFQTLYGHLNEILVRRGQWVNQGQLIGRMGTTGRSTGSHLHFTIYRNGVPINPLDYLL
ncbi:MAG: M23 family metallopeptidase [Spirochaetales bacterium]|jgi:murein DD-endopeptidase MepM/ murein hydrolase activator NlpD|nr:M23 family metallopeptidase [Spirochaetales bacterium]